MLFLISLQIHGSCLHIRIVHSFLLASISAINLLSSFQSLAISLSAILFEDLKGRYLTVLPERRFWVTIQLDFLFFFFKDRCTIASGVNSCWRKFNLVLQFSVLVSIWLNYVLIDCLCFRMQVVILIRNDDCLKHLRLLISEFHMVTFSCLIWCLSVYLSNPLKLRNHLFRIELLKKNDLCFFCGYDSKNF